MIICVDIEATCDISSAAIDTMEIIEIGAVMCTLDGSIISEYGLFVKPAVNPVLSDFCKHLTGISQSDIDGAVSFAEAIQKLKTWQAFQSGTCDVWTSWGSFDRNLIHLQSKNLNTQQPFPPLHLSAKKLFAKQRRIKQVGLRRAISMLGMTWQGTHHRALDDARNLSRVIPYIDFNFPSNI